MPSLLTSRAAPGEIPITLPDLRSRLRALPLAHIEPPDEGLSESRVGKAFSDRQLAVEPHSRQLSCATHGSLDGDSRITSSRRVDRLSRQAAQSTRAIAAEALALIATDTE